MKTRKTPSASSTSKKPTAPHRPVSTPSAAPAGDRPRSSPRKTTRAAQKKPAKPATPPEKKTVSRKPAKVKVPPILLEGDVPPPPPAHGPGQKYALGPSAPPPHAGAGEPGELPEAYGTGRLFLAARDPHWLYVSWDLTAQQLRNYNRRAADKHLHLRVFLDKPSVHPATEVAVHPESRNWFVHVGKGGARYVAQLGYYDARRRWHTISESDATFTPPDSLAEDTTARFATVPPDVTFEHLLRVVKEVAREHLPLAQAISEMTQSATEAEKSKAAMVLKPAPPPAPAATTAPPPWSAEQERALAKILSMDTVRRVWIGSLEITELVRRRLARELASQAAVPSAPELGGVASLASPFGGPPPGQKGFWFNVNAELVVYGATEPDASVTIGGRPIQLRPDGSFSYRFALPDGQYDLPIVAVSADKSEGRGADLHFTRHTEYLGEVGAHPQDPGLQPPLPENL